MPYSNEYASYQPLKRIVESDKVKDLLKEARCLVRGDVQQSISIHDAEEFTGVLPSAIVAIDGSIAEVDVATGYPGAKVGYTSVASVILDLAAIDRLDTMRPADPVLFRKTEKASSDEAALPGCNVVLQNHASPMESFRGSLYKLFKDSLVDEDEGITILDTYNKLLSLRPQSDISCPCGEDCGLRATVSENITTCPCNKQKVVYPTDALRIHERFNADSGSNQEAYSYVMKVWEQLILVNLLQCLEKRNWLNKMSDIAIFMDGPLAVFGPPAWLSAAMSRELRRINDIFKKESGHDLLIVGIEKTGQFITHMTDLDKKSDGTSLFKPGQYFIPTDNYIKRNIQFSDSKKTYGEATYFGRKFMYKTRTGALIIPCLATFSDEQADLTHDDISKYPTAFKMFKLIDKLVTSRYENALTPLVSAHANAAIPLHLGRKVLSQLSSTLMRKD